MTDLDEITSKLNLFKKTCSENPGLRNEFVDMAMLDMNFLGLVALSDVNAKFWLRFTDGKVNFGEGEVANPSLVLATTAATFNGILHGRILMASAQKSGAITFSGDGDALMDFESIINVVNEFLQNS